MTRWLQLALILTLSAFACGTPTEPVPNPVAQPVPKPVPIPDPAPTPPSRVAITHVDANDGTVTIAFSHIDDASLQYRLTCQSSTATSSTTGHSSPITLVGLTNGIRHSCTVTAFDAVYSSDPSLAVLVTPGPPQYRPSIFFVLFPGNGSALAAYDTPLDFLSDPRPWYIAVTCNGGGSTVTATWADSVVRTLALPGMRNGVTYSCVLRLTFTSAVLISSQVDVIPGTPLRPSVITTPGNTSISISLQPVTDNGFPVTGYSVTCGAPGQPNRIVNGTSSPLVVTGLANGTEYSCELYASNAMGPSQKLAITVTPGIPSAVKSITATATSNSATFSFSPPDTDNGSPITSYKVTCGEFHTGPVPPAPVLTASGLTSPITITGMSANKFHICHVFATNANGAGPQTEVFVTTLP